MSGSEAEGSSGDEDEEMSPNEEEDEEEEASWQASAHMVRSKTFVRGFFWLECSRHCSELAG